MNILITGAVTAQAYQLQRHLDTNNSLIFADSVDVPQSPNRRFIKIPASNSQSLAHLLLTTCLDQQIIKVYPLRKNEIRVLAEARQLFDEYGIKVMVPDKALIESLFNKGLKGEIVVQDTIVCDHMPDRGVFILDPESKDFQLFTCD